MGDNTTNGSLEWRAVPCREAYGDAFHLHHGGLVVGCVWRNCQGWIASLWGEFGANSDRHDTESEARASLLAKAGVA